VEEPVRPALFGVIALIMHLPTEWPWHTAWMNLWDTAVDPPAPATS
jgi:hypothetical protein